MRSANYYFILSLVFFSGCSSNSIRPTPTAETEPDRVIARIDDMAARPNWLHESQPFTIQGGIVTSLGQTQIPGDNLVDAAYRIAENSAKASIASAIKERVDFIFQQAQEGTAIDANQARFIGAAAANSAILQVRPGNRYWEKVATTLDSGQRSTQYRVYASVTMPESDFKRAVLEAARKASGHGGVSQDFSVKIEQHWNDFVKGGDK
jgi:hypothetical protein